tara:strand:- start:69 stop:1244 length:1176 start_codon:yes stop_codon:yes gene_type:complete
MYKPKIIFVDDEPQVLAGLRRALHGRKHEWEMLFFEDAIEALKTIEQNFFDILVTDMQMPVMSGLDLIKKVSTQQTGTACILLSGYTEKKVVVNSVNLVNQALLKPMDSVAVIAAIEKCLAVSNLPKTIRCKLISVGSLPGAPLADEELTKISKNPQARQSEFARFIISNPFLVARIIRIANSPFFGEQMHKFELMEAMRIVGTIYIKDLIEIGNSEHPEYFPLGVPSDYYRVINDSLEIAILCGEIMKEICIEKGDYEDAKILGLLSLIGRLFFYALDADKSSLILEQEELPIEAEKSHFGIDYATLSATFMSLWGMPDYVTNAILHHLQPSNSPYPSDLLIALHLAHHVKGINRPYGKISSGLKLDHEFLTGSKTGSSYKKIVERFQKV